MESILTKTGVTTLWNKIKSTFFPLSGGTVTGDTKFNTNVEVAGNTLVAKNISASADRMCFDLNGAYGGYIKGNGFNFDGAIYAYGAISCTGTFGVNAGQSSAVFIVAGSTTLIRNAAQFTSTLKTTGNVGIGVAVDTTHNLTVKTDAKIPSVYTNRLYPIDEDDFIIGTDDNSGYIKISTDMKGWDLDGYDEGTMDEPDSNWSISTGGTARFLTVYAPTINATGTATIKDLVITNSLKAKSGSTTYNLNFAKAIQLGLFTTA